MCSNYIKKFIFVKVCAKNIKLGKNGLSFDDVTLHNFVIFAAF